MGSCEEADARRRPSCVQRPPACSGVAAPPLLLLLPYARLAWASVPVLRPCPYWRTLDARLGPRWRGFSSSVRPGSSCSPFLTITCRHTHTHTVAGEQVSAETPETSNGQRAARAGGRARAPRAASPSLGTSCCCCRRSALCRRRSAALQEDPPGAAPLAAPGPAQRHTPCQHPAAPTPTRFSTDRSWLTMQPRTDLRRRSPLRRPYPRKHWSPGLISTCADTSRHRNDGGRERRREG